MGGCQFGSLTGPLPYLFADVAGVISSGRISLGQMSVIYSQARGRTKGKP